MIVATATDSGYVELTAVMLASLAANARDDYTKVYVFGDRLTVAEKAALRASYPLDNLVMIDLTEEDMRFLAGMPIALHVSRTTYARFLMPFRVDQDETRLLYIDCDAIVNDSLRPLRDIDMQGLAVGAVHDDARRRENRHFERNLAIGLPADTNYFNAGILLIDLVKWREEKLTERASQFATEHPNLPVLDQDALNGALSGQWLVLDERWNLHRRLEKGVYKGPPVDWAGAGIIHYIGQIKPNHADSQHPARDIFLAHRTNSAYAGATMKGKLDRKIEKRVRKIKRLVARVRRLFSPAAA
ncbi:glycosyltransferase family 8 protein [Ancylobacter amanitiformis]|uniref:Lipopolysaccharide biosynthesis glycosyltransferase n=1 Tax=Ancylobacter amanitiformis TaxID=217069 RepID=A0ABU0LLQ1_9HYPH|nr:glycosyltransferase family 8 protein [Ancylobacter amanitiformis]MDQ0509548.1 lipopolysaccharide biosynthesis glycosyltransferase [Ancylobacter amanitiformis]